MYYIVHGKNNVTIHGVHCPPSPQMSPRTIHSLVNIVPPPPPLPLDSWCTVSPFRPNVSQDNTFTCEHCPLTLRARMRTVIFSTSRWEDKFILKKASNLEWPYKSHSPVRLWSIWCSWHTKFYAEYLFQC